MFLRQLRVDDDESVERRSINLDHSTNVLVAKYKCIHKKQEKITVTFQTWSTVLELNWLDHDETKRLIDLLTAMQPAPPPPKPKRKVTKKKTVAKKKTTTRRKTKAK